MAVGYRFPNGVDFDSVYAGRVTNPTSLTGFRGPDGTDLAFRYEAFNGAGQAGPSGYRRTNGVDLSSTFTTVASNPINGKNFSASGGSNQNGGSATGVVTFQTNGDTHLVNQGSDHAPITVITPWSVAIFNGQGDLYEIHFDTQTGTITGSFGVWMSLSQARTISCSRSGNGFSSGSCKWYMRRVNTVPFIATGNVNVSASVGQL
ncbi:MAG: hypothetical protein RR877_10440 [Aurantimicrobium sp.]|uniref:hypothetical protein n=1 Tax=Aurantimicrobium sp. TaxID=1930784 RepID=UPI002FCA2CDE